MTQLNFSYDPNAMLASNVQQANQASEEAKTVRETDKRLWSTSISEQRPKYAATGRLLPMDTPIDIQQQTGQNIFDGGNVIDGYPTVKLPIVNVLYHRIQLTKNGPVFRCKCLKRSMSDKRHGVCPTCDWVWNRYSLLKNGNPELVASLAQQGIDIEKAKKDNMKFLPFQRWFGNMYIREDRIQAEYTDTVKIWEFSDAVADKLVAAKDPEAIEKKEQEKAARRAAKGQPADDDDDVFSGMDEGKERFVPEHPMYGRDFLIMCKYSSKTIPGMTSPLPTYAKSHFATAATPIAYTTNPDGSIAFDQEKTMSILEQRHDLEAFAYGDMESKEALQKRLTEWLVSAQGESSVAAFENASKPTNNQNYYNNVVKNAPAPTPKVQTVDANAFAAGYNPQNNVQPQAQQAPAFSVPASAPAQQTQPNFGASNMNFGAPATQVAPQQVTQPIKQVTQPIKPVTQPIQQFTQPAQQFAQPAQQFAQPAQQPPVNFNANNIQAQTIVEDDDLPF